MPDLTGTDWGDVPGWVSAVATTGALLAAGFAAKFALGAYRIEERREARIEDDRRREQAGLVAAWMGVEQASRSHVPEFGAWIRNASQVPVYDLVVEFWFRGEPRANATMPVLPPAPDPVWLPRPVPEQPIAKADSRSIPIEEAQRLSDVAIGFTDSAGRTWWRGVSGELVDLDGHQYPRSLAPREDPEPGAPD